MKLLQPRATSSLKGPYILLSTVFSYNLNNITIKKFTTEEFPLRSPQPFSLLVSLCRYLPELEACGAGNFAQRRAVASRRMWPTPLICYAPNVNPSPRATLTIGVRNTARYGPNRVVRPLITDSKTLSVFRVSKRECLGSSQG
jgi:hypothetical protein